MHHGAVPLRQTYQDEVVRIADLVVVEDAIVSATFENCLILGPAIVNTIGNTLFDACTFNIPSGDVDDMVIVAPKPVQGVVNVVDVVFQHCEFIRVGFVGPEQMRQGFLDGMGPRP